MNNCPTSVLPASSTVYVNSLSALDTIANSAYSLALWERKICNDISKEVSVLTSLSISENRININAGNVENALREHFHMNGLNAEKLSVWLADMIQLTQYFIKRVQYAPVIARIETLDDVTCPRFHVDNSYLRLICTYRGQGTEWLDDEQVNRVAHANGAPNEKIIRYGQPSRMPEFAVGLMKGRQYPGIEEAGLFHRSPRPVPNESCRVLFCLECSLPPM